MKTVEIGALGEKLAAKFLKKNGYKILAKNVHISHNEIDVIAKNKEFIVFVEIKTRSTDELLQTDFGIPASAVTQVKQKRTVSAARGYLSTSKYSKLQPRFDVIEVYLHKDTHNILKINHIINAFGA